MGPVRSASSRWPPSFAPTRAVVQSDQHGPVRVGLRTRRRGRGAVAWLSVWPWAVARLLVSGVGVAVATGVDV